MRGRGRKLFSLLLDSRVLRDQELNERRQQRFASLADVVHELEESQVDREFLLGNTPDAGAANSAGETKSLPSC